MCVWECGLLRLLWRTFSTNCIQPQIYRNLKRNGHAKTYTTQAGRQASTHTFIAIYTKVSEYYYIYTYICNKMSTYSISIRPTDRPQHIKHFSYESLQCARYNNLDEIFMWDLQCKSFNIFVLAYGIFFFLYSI